MPLWMRNRTNQVTSRCDDLPRLDQHFAGDWQVNLRKLREANVGAALSLADSFTEPDERSGRQSQAVFVKHEHDAVALVRLDPQGIRGTSRPNTLGAGMQIHDSTLNRTACGVGAECINADSHPVGLALHNTAIGRFDFDYFAVNRADDTKRRGRDIAPRITKEQEQEYQGHDRDQREPGIETAQRVHEQGHHKRDEWQAFRCDEWITLASQVPDLLMQRGATIPWITPRVNTGAVFPTKTGING